MLAAIGCKKEVKLVWLLDHQRWIINCPGREDLARRVTITDQGSLQFAG